jgi:hypothetical protein
MIRPNNLRWWFIRLQCVTILSQPRGMIPPRPHNLVIVIVMFSQLLILFRTFICATPVCWWRSIGWLSLPQGPVFSNLENGTRFCSSWIPCANDCHWSVNTHNFSVITAWVAAVRLTPGPPSLGVVMNTNGFCESWNFNLHFCTFIITHFCIHVEHIHMICKILS